jgi:hypothetical protein
MGIFEANFLSFIVGNFQIVEVAGVQVVSYSKRTRNKSWSAVSYSQQGGKDDRDSENEQRKSNHRPYE